MDYKLTWASVTGYRLTVERFRSPTVAYIPQLSVNNKQHPLQQYSNNSWLTLSLTPYILCVVKVLFSNFIYYGMVRLLLDFVVSSRVMRYVCDVEAYIQDYKL